MLVLKGRSLLLRELEDSDTPILFAWRNSQDFMNLCSTRRNSVSFEEFARELREDIARDRPLQLVIERDSRSVGTIYAYGLNLTDGFSFFTVFMDSQTRGRGLGAAASVLFLEFLFRRYGLFKVYADVYSYNSTALQTLRRAGFRTEGEFYGHRRVGDQRHDVVRLAYYREQIAERASLLRSLTGIDPGSWI